MRRSLASLLLALGLLTGATALAANERRHKPADYQEITEEDRSAARDRARHKVRQWREADPMPEYHFPWMPIGFTVLTLGLAAPFAWAAYNRHAKELRERAALAPQPRKRTKPTTETAEE